MADIKFSARIIYWYGEGQHKTGRKSNVLSCVVVSLNLPTVAYVERGECEVLVTVE